MSRPEIDADLAAIDAALRGEDDGSELGLLVADVRASAPRMSPQLERRLDAIGTAPPRRRWSRRRGLGPAGGGVAAAAGVAIAFGLKDEQRPESTGRPVRGVLHSAPAAPSAAPPAPAAPAVARRVERDVSLTLAA